jgi:hypothetical protein
MQQIVQTTLFENLKEKLSNPILYTYFFVFVSCNYQNILFLMYEPINMSFKISRLEGEWLFWSPVFNTLWLVIILTIINTVYEYYKQIWHRILQWCLDKTKIKEFVALEFYEQLKSKYEGDKVKLTTAIERNDTLEKLGKEYIDKISELTKDIKNLKSAHIVEVNQLNENNKTAQGPLGKSNSPEQLKKIRLNSSLVENVTINSSTLSGPEERIFKSIPKEGLWLLKYLSMNKVGELKVLTLFEGVKILDNNREITIENNHRFKTNIRSAISALQSNGWIETNSSNEDSSLIQMSITTEGYRYSDCLDLGVDNNIFAA